MTYIRTYSGKDFDIYNLSTDLLDIESIAHGLSQTCRFSGQCKRFYSVAEHSCRISIHVADLITKRLPDSDRLWALKTALWGLLHDASEAYLPDMPSPFKRLPELDGFRKLEKDIMDMVVKKFNLPNEEDPIVKECDTRIIINERNALMNMTSGTWESNDEPLDDEYMKEYGLAPQDAKEWFLDIYETLTTEIGQYEKQNQKTV